MVACLRSSSLMAAPSSRAHISKRSWPAMKCTKKTRPPAKARFGSVCERLFGTTNTQFIHNLRGNTQITRNVRQVTKSVNPRGQAVWTLAALEERLSEYVFEIYDTAFHPSLGQSPRGAFTAGLESGGLRKQRMISYDEDFLITTLPTTPKGIAKVVPGRGVKVNQIHYWSDRFRNPAVEGTRVAVRYDPFDAGAAYAYVERQWVRCCSEYHTVFQGRSREGDSPGKQRTASSSPDLYWRERRNGQETG